MAFQPFCVGTVTRTLTLPLASRTGRITPGITERISGIGFQQLFENVPHPVDDAVLDLQPVFGGAQPHRSQPSPPRSGTKRHSVATRESMRPFCFQTTRSS